MSLSSQDHWVGEFARKALDVLGPLANRSGHLLYSAASTLRPGTIYLMGVNPGGDPVRNSARYADKTIAADLAGLPGRSTNHYLDAVWNRAAGQSRLQRRVASLFAELGVDLRSTCAGNLIFVRTPSASAIDESWADACWPVHEMIIERVQPRVLLVFGTGRWPFGYLRRKLAPDAEYEPRPSGHGNVMCKLLRGSMLGRERVIFAVPHLSRFVLRDPATLSELRSLVLGAGPG